MSWGTSLKISATLHLSDGSELVGALHVQSAVANHPGPESIVELMDRPESFLVFTLEEDGVRFVPKAQVALVETALVIQVDADRRSAVRFLNLEIEMMSARVLVGFAESELPPNRSRAQDFLNESGMFFPLTTEGTLWAVNRTHVRTVRPVD